MAKRKLVNKKVIGAGVLVAVVGLMAGAQLTVNRSVAAERVVVVAAGDISCDPGHRSYNGGAGMGGECRMMDTSNLAMGMNPDAVLALGDLQYERGALADFFGSYHHNWGRMKAITRPVPGNHEYYTLGAAGYYTYFGAAAGLPGVGYYSYDLGDWHVVALNSNCLAVGGCSVGSIQERWLRADLAANRGACTLAYWHSPRFSSGGHGNDASVQPLWQALQDFQADVVLSGHDHDYERFAPQRADGVADENGIVQFVAGMGGKNLDPFRTIRDNSVVRENAGFGVLKLVLDKRSYAWEFVTIDGVVKDSGSADCVTKPAGATVVTPEPTPRPKPR